jgi:rhamnose utilization protein RhaD (predicted bifunctional aldolase and dehydrogenase)
MIDHRELSDLKDLSARVGRNPLLVQAASGNTSIKIEGVLWIKASGKWLVDAAQDDIFVPGDLREIFACLHQDIPYVTRFTAPSGVTLAPSIETAMHAVLPHRVVIHVHSVNAISWAVREDGREWVAERLAGLAWNWIPYVPSGFALARQIQRSLGSRPDVLILANHGLVIGGEDCEATEALLAEVEKRLDVIPRPAPCPDRTQLDQLATNSGWRVPEEEDVHALGTDSLSSSIFAGGTLYPCHGLFLGPGTAELRPSTSTSEAAARYKQRYGIWPSTLVVNGDGVLVAEDISLAQTQVLIGLAQVIQRIDPEARVRYMSDLELEDLLNTDAYHYRQQVEASAYRISTRGPVEAGELATH